ncbi:MAG: hypothetical protein QOE46_1939 [Acidobacteriota bacterium]|nr:hypothetical protein [Acidobacteriota bacterium]
MLKVINVVGARPNFMKVAPVVEEMRRRAGEFAPLVVHTGQHYDEQMSDAFFRDLGLPRPDVHLGVGSSSHAQQTAAVMQSFEPVVLEAKPDWVLVVGDVNSTLACALVCSKMGVPVAHVEAGLRSRDRSMPEEVNRVLTDQLAELLLTPSEDANRNLIAEGIAQERIRFVGNVMIDSLFKQLALAEASTVRERLAVAGSDYAVATLHRPSNVDDPAVLRGILSALARLSRRLPVVFPIHPRTRKNIERFGLNNVDELWGDFRLVEPLGYLDFLRLYSGARIVLTDSGGIQEETTALGIPCLTLRANTERPITVEMGTNRVVGTGPERIVSEAEAVLARGRVEETPRVPPLWDGRTAERILDALLERTRELRRN